MNPILDKITVNKIVLAMYVAPFTGAHTHRNRASHGLAFISDGEAEYIFDKSRTFKMTAGSVIYLPKYSNYEVVKKNEQGVYAINFDTAEDIKAEPFVHKFAHPDEIKTLYRRAIKSYLSRDANADFFLKSAVYSLLSTVIWENENAVTGSLKDVVAPAVRFIKVNYTAKQQSIPYLANLCSISETYFRRIFRSVYGISPQKYIMNLKFAYADELLRSGSYSVREVAELAGFPDQSSFSRFFKKMSGVPPTKA